MPKPKSTKYPMMLRVVISYWNETRNIYGVRLTPLRSRCGWNYVKWYYDKPPIQPSAAKAIGCINIVAYFELCMVKTYPSDPLLNKYTAGSKVMVGYEERFRILKGIFVLDRSFGTCFDHGQFEI